eukprot:CAMPEP_0115429798 /NCGR_PEP_ID=MMETSP0271-20121206/30707_1 /TAXON_ID=71861 /ORGANISM="Scrippsiella trochoidea, Strain CCMP3099" /LENGTH=58 /DNA_ID=CAMNT_0002854991 /DNA_START=257 /DNA_END=433 /DNA_ORIENTATION=-
MKTPRGHGKRMLPQEPKRRHIELAVAAVRATHAPREPLHPIGSVISDPTATTVDTNGL